ncbi:MAG: hypothetical protein HZB23_12860 [Deltaproteobacteria bacterium]|nr:hypothetical protein [Deltaproteobacteria bacterium]
MRLKIFAAVAVSCCLAASALAASARDDLAPADSGWTEKTGGRDYRTYLRYVKGADTAEVLMVGRVSKSPRECLAVATSYAAFPEFMPYIKFTRLLSSEKASATKTINTVFFYVEAPLVSPRFYTLRLTDEIGPTVCQSAWDLEKGAKRKTPADPAFAGKIPDPSSAVETPLNRGHWRFTALPGGAGTRVDYYVYTNPGGKIPPFIVNKTNAIAMPLLWKAFTERLSGRK